MISAMASASPVNPPISAAQITPATTTAAADPKLKTRARGVTSSTYRGGLAKRQAHLNRAAGLREVALAKSGACRQYRGRSAVHRVDDLAVVDALQVDRGDPEVRMAELPLYDVERDALAGHLDGVGMS